MVRLSLTSPTRHTVGITMLRNELGNEEHTSRTGDLQLRKLFLMKIFDNAISIISLCSYLYQKLFIFSKRMK